MLSKASTLILGIIAEKPINPYEITKLMDYISIRNWLSLAPSSIYATIKTLQDKKYITGKNIREGNMPEKTVYTVTEAGKQQLTMSIEGFLGNLEWDYAQFNIATILICHIEKGRALCILNEKISKLNGKTDMLQSKLKKLEAAEPLPGLHAIRHMIYLTNAEINSAKELIRTITDTKDWNHYLAKNIVMEESK
jgi:DNA-binding PadR family transcriptional regulator